MHCGIDAELCGQVSLTDPLEITDRKQNWPDEQQYHEQDWSACQQHEDPDPTQIKVEKLPLTSSQEETVHEFKPERSFYVEPHFSNHNQTLRNQTFHPTEEERRDVEAEGSNLFRVSQPFSSHYPAPQGVCQESAGGPVNGESFKEHPLSGVMERRRTNSNLCHKVFSVALEGAGSGLTKERRHTCPICTKRFKESSHLKEHVRIHTGEKLYRCEQCGTNFRQSGALTLHTRIHTGERPYECSGCGRRFNRKGDMESHMVTHTGERPHLCLVCGKSYRRKSNLKMHLKIHAEGQKLHTQPL
ncbi:zinc finger protein 567-like isoform X2 [Betta splendens]|uniref:Zinc finger protein 567-like isoform X2 n=1 Tax=Betta splendens TaxID=158456 RepID=A0A8M1HE66_BETSP|nr:zinc finger protein 567-like isoform X2 [Betta splendens]